MAPKYRDHNEQLARLQEEYLSHRAPAVLAQMYSVLVQLAANMVRDYWGRRVRRHINKVELRTKAHDIATEFISHYLRKPHFRVNTSFSGYLRNGPWLRVMYGEKKHDQTISIETLSAYIEWEEELLDAEILHL